ncbi:cytochrome P450 [Microthyrium microscopicum]|uniref:Cytochrome P450 n=1 Tax=Microthyrium microscopicum TaxID=703497 RepID=A0A6A6TZE4_9PEZI|nr:cytochrome P450 [Microthyrium microscopicum]
MLTLEATKLVITASTLSLLYVFTLVVYRLYFHPLCKFPGPKLAAATQFYELYYDIIGKGGMFIWEIERMHEIYGPIVRINPDELHVKDPDFYDDIYAGGNKKRDKYAAWVHMAGAAESAFSTVDHDVHRLRRVALNPFFSKRSVFRLEPRIQDKVDKLCNRLESFANTDRVLELDIAYAALTLDVITEYAYGSSYNYLDDPDFKPEWKECMNTVFEQAAFRRATPWMTRIVQTFPDEFILKMMPALAVLIKWQQDIKTQVKSILDAKQETSDDADNPNTIFHALRDSDSLPIEEKSFKRLTDEAEILVAAGSETTARTLSYTSFYLINTSSVLDRLRAELRIIMPDKTSKPTWSKLEQSEYLCAVVSEGLRISCGITTRLPRLARESIIYKDWVVPPGTPISQTTYFISMDPEIFPEPEKFKPERWLNKEKRLDRYLTSFSKGSRGCVGINLAYAELFLTIAYVFRHFDFELWETTIEDVKIDRDLFVPASKPGSKGVRLLVKSVD